MTCDTPVGKRVRCRESLKHLRCRFPDRVWTR